MPPDTLDKALNERQQLSRSYRASKRAQFERAFAEEPRLEDFGKDIRACGAHDAEQLIKAVKRHNHNWLRNASADTRALALELVDRRIIQIRTRAGLAPIDDALPGEPDSVWEICKRILA